MQKHKWKKLSGKPIKGELEKKACTKCGLQMRRTRRGNDKPRCGWIEVHYRKGKVGIWRKGLHGYLLPKCEVSSSCPTCNGTGRVTKEVQKNVGA